MMATMIMNLRGVIGKEVTVSQRQADYPSLLSILPPSHHCNL